MKERRRKYSESKLSDEREKLVTEILTLEKQVYGLDSEINDFYFSARGIEKPIVKKLIMQGTYNLPDNKKNGRHEKFIAAKSLITD